LAAHRSGLKRIILPKRNKDDLEDLPESVQRTMEFIFAETVMDVLKNALREPKKSKRTSKTT